MLSEKSYWNQSMEISPISGALGAEISGIDISKKLTNTETLLLQENFLKFKVLFFRNQNLSAQTFVSFAKHFGDPTIYPFIKGLDDTPEVIEIIKTKDDKKNFGGSWHSDTSYMECPAMATLLYAKETPKFGGDTLFANTALAYEQLSQSLKELLHDLVGVNSSEKGYAGGRATGMSKLSKMNQTYNANATSYETEHPIIRTHPETGQKSLYLNLSHTSHFSGMTVKESKPLINYLCKHMIRPEFTCRLRWSEGSLAIWDNRATLHHAINDYPNQRRHMLRITLAGDRPH